MEKSNTPKSIYDNGIFAKFSEEEFAFIKQYQNDPSVNVPPSAGNIYEDATYRVGGNDKLFSHALPKIENGMIVGVEWRTPTLPGTISGNISTDTTKSAIDMVKSGEISPREAMFIIRARVGIESAKAPVKNEYPSPNASYGVGQSTSFNSPNMVTAISNQDNARKLLNAFNEWSRRLDDKDIKQTVDDRGVTRYLKFNPNATKPEERWILFVPEVEPILNNIPESQKNAVLKDLDHLASGKETRKSNDDSIRKDGPKLDMFSFVVPNEEGGHGSGGLYKSVKTVTQYAFYPTMIGTFSLIFFLKIFGVYSAHTAHHLNQVIEKVSVSAKSFKNLTRQTEPHYQSWTDYFSPIYSVFAPFGWYQVGHVLEKIIARQAPKLVSGLSIFAGPAVTAFAIALEFGYEWWVKPKIEAAKERERLYQEAIEKGYLPGPYMNSGGAVKIPTKRLILEETKNGNTIYRDRFRIPIGIKKDKDGEAIHLKYKDIDPNTTIPEVDVPVLDLKGNPIPGSWQPVFIYGTDIIASADPTNLQIDTNEPGQHLFDGDLLCTYNDYDENVIRTNISLNETINDNTNRSSMYDGILDKNKANGFYDLSVNGDVIPQQVQPPEPPTRGGHSGDEPEYNGWFYYFDKAKENDPDGNYGDWVADANASYFPDPYRDMYGIPHRDRNVVRERLIAANGGSPFNTNPTLSPTKSPIMIPNGNVDDVIPGYIMIEG